MHLRRESTTQPEGRLGIHKVRSSICVVILYQMGKNVPYEKSSCYPYSLRPEFEKRTDLEIARPFKEDTVNRVPSFLSKIIHISQRLSHISLISLKLLREVWICDGRGWSYFAVLRCRFKCYWGPFKSSSFCVAENIAFWSFQAFREISSYFSACVLQQWNQVVYVR